MNLILVKITDITSIIALKSCFIIKGYMNLFDKCSL